MKRPAALVAALGLFLTSTLSQIPAAGQAADPVLPYRKGDAGVTVMNVLPPGQGRYLNAAEFFQYQGDGTQPTHNTDQWAMYDSLVQGAPNVKTSELNKYFKDASFGVKEDDIERRYQPRSGVVVLRDAGFGVPHVYGATRADVMFGAGYVTGEDRLFMIDVLRHVGRGRLSEFLGASEANLAMDRASYASAGYNEEELAAMLDRAELFSGATRAYLETARQDLEEFAAGINAFIDEAMTDPTLMPAEYEALQVTPAEWTATDTVAVAALIGASLGVGGGGELRNAAFLSALEKKGFSPRRARRILDDFHRPNDPEAPTKIAKRFSWSDHIGKVNPKAVARPDDAQEVTAQLDAIEPPEFIDGPFGPIRLAFPEGASNAVLISGKLSKSGRPIAVMGPQTGYWSPEILMELDLHGPGIHTRGVGFPGISLYTLLGRGRNYAYSATSASGDLVDIFAEKLCNPDGGEVDPESTFYIKGNKCVEMYTRTDSWTAKPSAGGVPGEPSQESVRVEMVVQRTDDGIVWARGTVKGQPVAFVAKRSSFGGEVDSASTYVQMSDPAKVRGARDFQEAFGRFNFTFNWFYIDHRDIAYQLGGKYPIRARGVDPDLPVWGTGRWGWKGFRSYTDNPRAINPDQGYVVSWNNKQAPGWRAADDHYSYSSVHRAQLLIDKVESYKRRHQKLGLADIVNIMGDAATQDLRGYRVLPYMLKLVGTPKEEQLATAVGILKKWMRSGAHRRDQDEDGAYEHAAAVALMDAWWERALQAVFVPVLGQEAYDAIPSDHHDEPGPVGSAFYGGLYGVLEKDLRSALGLRVKGKFSRIYCGKGSRSKCRTALLKSLKGSIAALTEEFGADPQQWDAREEVDFIQYVNLGVVSQDPMQWQNRPTFQQLVEFHKP